MKKYIKTALDTLEALDCRLDRKDRELRTDRWQFTHPNAPDELFTLNFKSSETAARAVVQRARVAAGLATSASGNKRKPKQNQRIKMERAAEHKRREAAHSLAEAARAEARIKQLEAQTVRNYRELDRLIRGPGETGAASSVGLSPTSMLTIEQVADHTGLTDRAVRQAIQSGRIEAYQCGKQIKVKGIDVREWLHS